MDKIIFIAPNLETARQKEFDATVEAEYGSFVVYGKKETLYHHVNPQNPCPCLYENNKNNNISTILVSHIDLDSIGGCLALLGQKPEVCPDFWELAAYIDVNGSHNLDDAPFSNEAKVLLIAFWYVHNKKENPRFKELTDVTETIMEYRDILSSLENYISEAKDWYSKSNAEVEKRLVYENENFRIFKTERLWCNSAYRSMQTGKIVPFIITYNIELKSFTVSTCLKDENIHIGNILKEIFGDKAGGHAGIGGTPRGEEFEFEDHTKIIEKLREKNLIS